MFAVRKLREHFLLGLDQDTNPKKKSQSPPAERNEYVNFSQEALEEMLRAKVTKAEAPAKLQRKREARILKTHNHAAK